MREKAIKAALMGAAVLTAGLGAFALTWALASSGGPGTSAGNSIEITLSCPGYDASQSPVIVTVRGHTADGEAFDAQAVFDDAGEVEVVEVPAGMYAVTPTQAVLKLEDGTEVFAEGSETAYFHEDDAGAKSVTISYSGEEAEAE